MGRQKKRTNGPKAGEVSPTFSYDGNDLCYPVSKLINTTEFVSMESLLTEKDFTFQQWTSKAEAKNAAAGHRLLVRLAGKIHLTLRVQKLSNMMKDDIDINEDH